MEKTAQLRHFNLICVRSFDNGSRFQVRGTLYFRYLLQWVKEVSVWGRIFLFCLFFFLKFVGRLIHQVIAKTLMITDTVMLPDCTMLSK